MTSAILLAIGLFAGPPEGCHFVTRSLILALPSCDISPTTVAALTERPADPGRAVTLRRPRTSRQGLGRATSRVAQRVVPLTKQQLERRFELAQQERVVAVARRLAAEAERDAARRERDEALRQLQDAREALRLAAASARCGLLPRKPEPEASARVREVPPPPPPEEEVSRGHPPADAGG